MTPPIPVVSIYAKENQCPHCKRPDSINIAGYVDENDDRGYFHYNYSSIGDEICHCNMCGKSFVQHYERRFIGQTKSGESHTEPMPDSLDIIATDAENYVRQLLVYIAEQANPEIEIEPEWRMAMLRLMQLSEYRRASTYLDRLDKHLSEA